MRREKDKIKTENQDVTKKERNGIQMKSLERKEANSSKNIMS